MVNYNIFSREHPKYVVEQLHDRALIRVAGSEASIFLQGLVTNDMDHINDDGEGVITKTIDDTKEKSGDQKGIALSLLRRSMYAMFLNNSGRVMFDVIIIQKSNECFLIDCNAELASKLVKHLKMYRVRRKVDISMDDVSKVWTVFTNEISPIDILNQKTMAEDFIELGLGVDGIISTADPRNKQLGFRVIVLDDKSQSAEKLNELKRGSENGYKVLRYKLGVGECPNELDSGKALPLESNCDYLHGVSFHKGCYIGQELTARTHHTGVIRKRIMPLSIICTNIELSNDKGLNLENLASGKSIGKLMGYTNGYGLGLMRVQDSFDAKTKNESIVVSDDKSIKVEIARPEWWPLILPNKVPDK